MSRARGFSNARRKSQNRVRRLDSEVTAGIAKTVEDVHRTGEENMDLMVKHKSGRLKRGYRKRLTGRGLRGLVGYLSAAARRSVFYAKFVHDGTATARARPFHDDAVLEHEVQHRQRMRNANKTALKSRF